MTGVDPAPARGAAPVLSRWLLAFVLANLASAVVVSVAGHSGSESADIPTWVFGVAALAMWSAQLWVVARALEAEGVGLVAGTALTFRIRDLVGIPLGIASQVLLVAAVMWPLARVFPDTFDPVRFSPQPAPAGLRERYGLKASDQVLLCVSRLEASEQYKGYRQILEVLPSLTRKIPALKFVIVGRGNDRPNIEQQIGRLNLGDRVILAGFVPSQELADHYRMADAFAMPSKREGFGIVYLEAMGCGKKCLGGNKDAAVDALRHGELGILVDPDNLPELEDGLFRLMTGPKPSPREIHEKANEYFGRASFKTKVKALLESFGLR